MMPLPVCSYLAGGGDATRGDNDGMPSTGVLPGNLPRQLTSFVGRERELRELRDLLERSRLLTLTGPGGSGKTRLGLQLAAEVASGFHDGLYFVALAPVGKPDLVLSCIAQGVGLGDVGNRPLLDRLCRHLESARVLLLLDNFEHLTVSAPVVAALLQGLQTGAGASRGKPRGREFRRIGRFEPTSQVCSAAKDGRKPLHIRTWRCPGCEAWLDRDINAAVNVARAAGLAVTACGAQVRPGVIPAQRVEAGTHPKSRRDAA
jgi:Putative transposase DNA-binding domain/AAA domain